MRKDGKTYDIGLKYIHKGDIPKLGSTVYTLEKDRSDGEFISKDLSPNERNEIVELVWKHRDVFAEELEDLGIAEVPSCEIKLEDDKPIRCKPYKLAYNLQSEVDNQISDMKDQLIIRQTDKREEYKNLYETTKAKFSSEELIDATRRRFYERDGELYFKEGNNGKMYPRPERITVQLFTKEIPRGRIGRWALKLRNYNFDIIHKDGSKNPADFLSRYPTETGESEVLTLGQTDKREEYKNLYETTKAKFSSEELIDATRRRFYERDGELYFKEGNNGKMYPRPERITGICSEYHNVSHVNLEDTLRELRRDLYVPNVRSIVEGIVKSCESCQRNNYGIRRE
ncbi:hypothetical protein AYI69_g3191 [Smittium culicis]|uniref:Integrase zinc-binding domain-containing protein n=1 Tax=Smittium culicis TaxID=133412 RepID=A0A1R1YKE2_9FUNG|nr:hypothetical protein AYI69_g3191 [Smittium culicis]